MRDEPRIRVLGQNENHQLLCVRYQLKSRSAVSADSVAGVEGLYWHCEPGAGSSHFYMGV